MQEGKQVSDISEGKSALETILYFIRDTQITGVLLGFVLSLWASTRGKVTFSLADYGKISVYKDIEQDAFGIGRGQITGNFQVDVQNNKPVGIILSDFYLVICRRRKELCRIKIWSGYEPALKRMTDKPVDVKGQSSLRIYFSIADSYKKHFDVLEIDNLDFKLVLRIKNKKKRIDLKSIIEIRDNLDL
jgi:hypothetical protein